MAWSPHAHPRKINSRFFGNHVNSLTNINHWWRDKKKLPPLNEVLKRERGVLHTRINAKIFIKNHAFNQKTFIGTNRLLYCVLVSIQMCRIPLSSIISFFIVVRWVQWFFSDEWLVLKYLIISNSGYTYSTSHRSTLILTMGVYFMSPTSATSMSCWSYRNLNLEIEGQAAPKEQEEVLAQVNASTWRINPISLRAPSCETCSSLSSRAYRQN